MMAIASPYLIVSQTSYNVESEHPVGASLSLQSDGGHVDPVTDHPECSSSAPARDQPAWDVARDTTTPQPLQTDHVAPAGAAGGGAAPRDELRTSVSTDTPTPSRTFDAHDIFQLPSTSNPSPPFSALVPVSASASPSPPEAVPLNQAAQKIPAAEIDDAERDLERGSTIPSVVTNRRGSPDT